MHRAGALRDRAVLEAWCLRQEGGPYPAYRDLRGSFQLHRCVLSIDRVQPDPFAGPTRLRLFIPWGGTGVPPELCSLPGGGGTEEPGRVDPRSARALGWRDWIGRVVEGWLQDRSARGAAAPRIAAYGPAVLDRSAVRWNERELELRLEADLPARGRRILGRAALQLLVETPDRLVDACLAPGSFDVAAATAHAAVIEDYAYLQEELERRGWLAFVAEGSRLARRAGNDDRPLEADASIPFTAPATLCREVRLPHAGAITGLAIEPGVTLLCGGGFHGKSTLLRALAAGVVPHRPGDGRERVATRPDAVTVRAEDGRSVHQVDLRPFLHDLPLGRSAFPFTTANASGSTSQAASIVEAIEGGSRLLLFDEDTSATNFMIRDRWMDRLLERHQEPITPYLDRVRELFHELDVSSILVIGGSGEYFRVADRVLVLDTFQPVDRTDDARAIAATERGAGGRDGGGDGGRDTEPSAALRAAVDPSSRPQPAAPSASSRIRALDPRRLLVGTTPLDLPAAEALRDVVQARFLALVLSRREGEQRSRASGTLGIGAAGLIDWYLRTWRAEGLDGFGPEPRGDLAAVRWHEVLAAVNRLRTTDEGAREPDGRPRRT